MIRRAHRADAERLLPLIEAHARYERGIADCSVQRLRTALEPPVRLLAWIAVENDEAVGYASATLDFSTWSARSYLHLDCLFVVEASRGRGLGAALLEQVTEQARASGCAHLEWQTPSWNAGAARFYRRQGAHASSKVRFRLSCARDAVGDCKHAASGK